MKAHSPAAPLTPWVWIVLLVVALGVGAGCGSGGGPSDGNGGDPPVVSLPPGGTMRGLAAASSDLATWDIERGTSPVAARSALESSGLVPGSRFTAALPEASVSVSGATGSVSTGRDGSFSSSGLPPGDHDVALAKTVNGNLLDARFSLHIGTESGTAVLVEMSASGYRVTQRYLESGRVVERVLAPNGSTRATSGEALASYSLPGGATYVDSDGDGNVEGCTAGPRETVPSAPPSVPDEPSTKPEPPPTEPPVPCTIGPIARIELQTYFPENRLVVGQTLYVAAIGFDSNGSAQDVTSIVDWDSSKPEVADIDGWGAVTGRSAGSTRLTASLGGVRSDEVKIDVVPRPPLVALFVQNLDCYFYAVTDRPGAEDGAPPPDAGGGGGGGSGDGGTPVPVGDLFYPPSCSTVVEIGGERHYAATGQFGDAYYEDVTGQVRWEVRPGSVGTLGPDGTFRATSAGEAQITATLSGLTSEPTPIRVVTEPTLVSIDVYTDYPFPIPLGLPSPGGVAELAAAVVPPAEPPPGDGDGGTRPDDIVPCFTDECIPAQQTVLMGDTVQFHALGAYDTGLTRELVGEAQWSSSAPLVGLVGAGGKLTALLPGTTDVRASFGGLTSAPFKIEVVREATPVALWSSLEGSSYIVKKGEATFLHATAAYDVTNLTREVTREVDWVVSDPKVASVNGNGELVGKAPGLVNVTARLGGLESYPLSLEVWETSNLNYCDADHVNRGTWTDDLNRVVLETDCASYARGDTVTMRYTIDEIRPNPGALLDPCLDLYVYRDDSLVRTIREEGCGQSLVPEAGAAPADATLYQTLAFWDQRDAEGHPVDAGRYRIVGRFYIYYDPIVELEIEVR